VQEMRTTEGTESTEKTSVASVISVVNSFFWLQPNGAALLPFYPFLLGRARIYTAGRSSAQ